MKRFFFDIDDGHCSVRDTTGVEAANVVDIRSETIAALPDILQELAYDEDHKEICVCVRDETSRAVLRMKVVIDVAVMRD
jgi:hypothetical protein